MFAISEHLEKIGKLQKIPEERSELKKVVMRPKGLMLQRRDKGIVDNVFPRNFGYCIQLWTFS